MKYDIRVLDKKIRKNDIVKYIPTDTVCNVDVDHAEQLYGNLIKKLPTVGSIVFEDNKPVTTFFDKN